MFIPTTPEEFLRSDPENKTEPPTNAESLICVVAWSVIMGFAFWGLVL